MDMAVTSVDLACIVTVDMFPTEGGDPSRTMLITEHSRLKVSIDTWHWRLGHLNANAILCMVYKGMVKGMKIMGGNTLTGICEPCLKGKQAHTEI